MKRNTYVISIKTSKITHPDKIKLRSPQKKKKHTFHDMKFSFF